MKRGSLATHARACLAMVVLIAGCSEAPAVGPDVGKLVPVSGKVTLDGKPLAGATVNFMPKASAKTGFGATGTTDEAGEYSLEVHIGNGKTSEGVLPGIYDVTVTKLTKLDGTPVKFNPDQGPMSQGPVKQAVPMKYASVNENGLSYTVPAEGGTYDVVMEGGPGSGSGPQ
ncbi:MAG TPA: carboxypeptidase-like regulatory domain-containing protein [Planctomycetaceae bacterium]